MSEKRGVFDAEAFYEALDATREARSQNWKEVAQSAGVSASTLTRMAQGKRPDVDSLARLVTWSGLDPADYLIDEGKRKPVESLAVISTLLKTDKHLSAESAAALDRIIRTAYNQLRHAK